MDQSQGETDKLSNSEGDTERQAAELQCENVPSSTPKLRARKVAKPMLVRNGESMAIIKHLGLS